MKLIGSLNIWEAIHQHLSFEILHFLLNRSSNHCLFYNVCSGCLYVWGSTYLAGSEKVGSHLIFTVPAKYLSNINICHLFSVGTISLTSMMSVLYSIHWAHYYRCEFILTADRGITGYSRGNWGVFSTWRKSSGGRDFSSCERATTNVKKKHFHSICTTLAEWQS